MSGESIGSIAAVPGLRDQSPGFIRKLWDICRRRGWNADAIAMAISFESRFNPRAKNPNGSAYGILQWIDSTKKAIGTSQAALEQMNAEEQLDYVEKYFLMMLRNRIPGRAGDYYLVIYGRVDGIGKPDDFAIDRRDSASPAEVQRYNWNKGLDRNKDGIISAGELRATLEAPLSRIKDRVYIFDEPKITSPKLLITAGILLVVGYLVLNTALPAPAPKRKALA